MPVYVDDSFIAWRGTRWCHMQADTPDELHAMADALGLKRAWFQTKPGRPWLDHYDVTPAKRERAIALGAVAEVAEEAGRDRRRLARKASR